MILIDYKYDTLQIKSLHNIVSDASYQYYNPTFKSVRKNNMLHSPEIFLWFLKSCSDNSPPPQTNTDPRCPVLTEPIPKVHHTKFKTSWGHSNLRLAYKHPENVGPHSTKLWLSPQGAQALDLDCSFLHSSWRDKHEGGSGKDKKKRPVIQMINQQSPKTGQPYLAAIFITFDSHYKVELPHCKRLSYLSRKRVLPILNCMLYVPIIM